MMTKERKLSFLHGAFEITVVSDGYLTLPADIIMPEAANATRRTILAEMGGGYSSAPLATNVPIIRTADDLVLIDVGSGHQFQDTCGALPENMRRIGIDPKDVTTVFFTHAHPDHMGGILDEQGALVFPNAEYFLSRAEWEFWEDDNRLPDSLRVFGKGARSNFRALAGRLNLVEPGQRLLDGLEVVPTPGHTPGHVSFSLEGQGELFITGDAVTNPIISFQFPDWRFGFDADHETASHTRHQLLDRLASTRAQVLGYHWKHPGLGSVEREGAAFRLWYE
jgi:glyoxylase-like metal-dependent hydrolase (beta-lactamase superfamily II)